MTKEQIIEELKKSAKPYEEYYLDDEILSAMLSYQKSYWYAIMTLLNVCILLLSHGKELLLLVISDTSNTETPKKEKKTYTVEEIAEQLCVSKKVAYALVKSGQFAYVRAGRAIRVSKDSFDKWLNQN